MCVFTWLIIYDWRRSWRNPSSTDVADRVCFLMNVSAPPAVWSHAAAEGEGQTHRPEAAVSRLLRSLRPPVLLRERPGCLQKTCTGETVTLHEGHVFPRHASRSLVLCFFHLTQDTLKELKAFISNTENPKTQDSASAESTDENNKSHDAAVSEPPEDPPSKRAKLEPGPSEEDAAAAVKLKDEESRVCVVCLGILQELCGPTQAAKVCVLLNIHSLQTQQSQRSVPRLRWTWDSVLLSQIAETVKAEKYEFDTLVLSVSLPAQLCVREVSASTWHHKQTPADLLSH